MFREWRGLAVVYLALTMRNRPALTRACYGRRAMAKISTPAVNQKVYRHFAIITVVVTLLVAVFANGENRQAVAAAVAERQHAAALAEYQAHKFGKPTLIQAEPLKARVYNSAADYSDTNSDYGAPMDRVGGRSQDNAVFRGAVNRGGGHYVPASYSAYQISDEELAKMTPAQRQALKAQLANGGLSGNPALRKKQIAALAAASQQRAGSENGVE